MEEVHDVEHVTEMRQCETTSATVKLARERFDETTSDVIDTVEVPLTQYIDRVMDDLCCAWNMVILILTRGLCVFLKRVASELSRLNGWIGNRDSDGSWH